ncbi:hypothetical protein GX563_08120 [Candidatus Bathyarchaeota archaeon]|nr:hypothetical protein [Candidatus Bathyarchaeota archaeon]
MDMSLVVGYKITGRVFDSSGNTLPGASTIVSNSTWTVPSVTSDGSGYYTIYAPAGTYLFGLWPPMNSNLINFKNNNFTVTSDMTYDIVMSSGYKVSGFIQYPSGEKVYGVTTYLVNGTGYSFSSGHYTDSLWLSGGYYIVAPAGNYTIKAQLNSVLIYSESNVTLSEDITKDLTLPTVSISPPTAVIDVGQSYPYVATTTGGSGTYSNFKWYVNGTAKATTDNPTFNFSPDSIGTYLVTAKVRILQELSQPNQLLPQPKLTPRYYHAKYLHL